MFRNDSAAGSANVTIVQSWSHGVSFQWRSTAGGGSSFTAISGINPPVWLKLVRSNATFTGSYSTDGDAWTQVSSQSVTMNNTVLAGLDVTAQGRRAHGAECATEAQRPGSCADDHVGALGTPHGQRSRPLRSDDTQCAVVVDLHRPGRGPVEPAGDGRDDRVVFAFRGPRVTRRGHLTRGQPADHLLPGFGVSPSFLGAELVQEHPIVKTWKVGSPAKMPFDEATQLVLGIPMGDGDLAPHQGHYTSPLQASPSRCLDRPPEPRAVELRLVKPADEPGLAGRWDIGEAPAGAVLEPSSLDELCRQHIARFKQGAFVPVSSRPAHQARNR